MFHNFQVPSFETDAIFVESEENEKCNTPMKRKREAMRKRDAMRK